MPEQREMGFYESGRATAPPGIIYSSLAGPISEGYSHGSVTVQVSTNLSDLTPTESIQSPHYSINYSNYVHHKTLDSSHYAPIYSSCPSPNLNYSFTVSKTNSSNLPVQSPQYTPNYSTSSHSYLPTLSSSSNFVSCNNSNISCNNNFEFPSTSTATQKNHQSSCASQENTAFLSSDHSSTLFNQKISKSSSVATPKYTPNYSYFSHFSNNQPKNVHNKESVDLCSGKNIKSKRDFEGTQKPSKLLKDDTEFNHNFEELQQFLSKHGTKIKNTTESNKDLVTDSLLHFLQKKTQEKNPQDNISHDLGDISQLLVSLTSKYKSDETSGLKKKEGYEDSKLMNDFLTKIILEKEEKRFKAFDDKKKIYRKDIFDDLSIELDERKIKRDAMSNYQEEKTHHKRSSNYGEFNQWDYLNQQDVQTPNNHNRRGHFSFSGTSQPHSVAWNPVGMGMTRQTNPYYSNPHGHVMPAHAHAEYRYKQWNNPNDKNIPNFHNVHSQNTLLPQTRMDIKHHADVSNSVQDFGLPVGPTSDLAKLGTSPRDTVLRTSSPEKSSRTAILSDHIASISPSMRNPSTLRTLPLPNHPKSVNNPLCDLQMLVTNQDGEHPSQKPDNYQQESVDLSAHSDTSKQNKKREEDKTMNDDNSERRNLRSPVTVIQTHDRQINSDFNGLCEKPVKLISKSMEKSAETKISSSKTVNNMEKKCPSIGNLVDGLKENFEMEVTKSVENITDSLKAKDIVGEDKKNACVNNSKYEVFIPGNIQYNETEKRTETKGEENLKDEKTRNPLVEDLNNATGPVATRQRETEQSEVQDSKTESRNSNEVLISVSDKNSGEKCESFKNNKKKAVNDLSDRESKKACLKLGSRLEKMFEGIGDENSDLPTVTSTSAETKPTLVETNKKTPKKKSGKSRVTRLSSGQSSSSESRFHGKKLKSISNKDERRKRIKKSLCDVMDRRGPFLHLEGSKECPSSVIVINFPKGDDEDEKDKNFIKKISSNFTKTKHQNELDYRGTPRNGLFSSTLSTRYDAHTTDYTWVCVFCKKGPHCNMLGDLFGPYIISGDENNSLCDFSGDEKDISDAQKRGGRNKKSLRSNNMVEHFQKMSRRLRRTQSSESCLRGINVISDEQVDQLRYEVWVHEQCAVWSPNVCLIGSRIVGMQEAIWSSIKTMCSKCGAFGANVGCVYRNCLNRSHYYCAKESGWSLVQETFISTCHIHKLRS